MERTHTNGELRLSDTGKEVTLLGWVAKRRNFGALVLLIYVIVQESHSWFLMKHWLSKLRMCEMNISYK